MKWLAVAIMTFGVASGVSAENFRVTNYDGPTTRTASGHRAVYGLCAADWRFHPPGTIIKLDTGERLVVADNGPGVKGKYHIDRYNPSHQPFPQVSRGYVVSRGGYCRNSQERYLAVARAIAIKKKLDALAQRKAQSGNIRWQASGHSRRWSSRNACGPRNDRKDSSRQYNSNRREVQVPGRPRAALSAQRRGQQGASHKARPSIRSSSSERSDHKQRWGTVPIHRWPQTAGNGICCPGTLPEDERKRLARISKVHEQSHRKELR